MDFLGIPAYDTITFNLSRYFYQAADFIDSALRAGGNPYHRMTMWLRHSYMTCPFICMKLLFPSTPLFLTRLVYFVCIQSIYRSFTITLCPHYLGALFFYDAIIIIITKCLFNPPREKVKYLCTVTQESHVAPLSSLPTSWSNVIWQPKKLFELLGTI